MPRDQRLHFIGVAGVGMSSVAQVAMGQGCRVTGSDRCFDQHTPHATIDVLQRCGVTFFPQNGSGVTKDTDAVVVSTAIEADNPDLKAAHAQGKTMWHRAQLLASLVRDQRCIAIAGTSGKSTVTGMVGWILEVAGLDPTVVNGAPLLNWQSDRNIGNARVGHGPWWVIEADESDRSLLNYNPEHAVITNMSADHFSIEETQTLFDAFRDRVHGRCFEQKDSVACLESHDGEVRAYESHFVYKDVAFTVGLPGRHNMENAMHAVLLCEHIGVTLETCAEALASFRGMHRRLEVVARYQGVTVVDDYAHNPAKITATLDALLPHAQRAIAVWRPHGYGPLRNLRDAWVEAFEPLSRGHHLLLLPVYDAGGTADRRWGSDKLVELLQKRGQHQVDMVADACAVRRRVSELEPRQGDCILVMGARDPGLPLLARALADDLT